MRNDCKTLEPLMHEYAEGWIGETERTQVQRHLHRCAACQEKLKAWREVGRALRELPRLPAPEPAPAPVTDSEPRFALKLALAMCLPVALLITAYSSQWQTPNWEQLTPYEPLLRLTERAHDWILTLWSWLRGGL